MSLTNARNQAQFRRPSEPRGGASAAVSVLDRSVRVTGTVRGTGDLLVDGTIEGRVQLGGHLTISEEASVTSVDGEVVVGDVTIAGTLRGTLRASGHVHLMPGGELAGEVFTDRFSMDAGGVFAGRLDATFELPPELDAKPVGKRR
jgi:cytoskeletal protein CcmA (bactofilin family)